MNYEICRLSFVIYPVRECPVTCHMVHFSHTSAGFNAPCEFSSGVYNK